LTIETRQPSCVARYLVKMYPPSPPVVLPESYAKLDLPHIKISHVPESSATPTPVLLLTLYRPQNYNAFTEVMRQSIVSFYDLVNVDDRVKAIVLTGDGKIFCAGADLDIGFNVQRRTERSVDHRDGFVWYARNLIAADITSEEAV
jgi:enoyl-CoA hydratase/carnithine racemase